MSNKRKEEANYKVNYKTFNKKYKTQKQKL